MKIKIDGLKDIDAALGQLTKAAAKGVMRRVLLARAKPIVADAKMKAPVGTGRLRESITARAVSGGAGKKAFADTMSGGGSRGEAAAAAKAANSAAKAARGGGEFVEVLIGPTKDAFYGHLVEFGTTHSGPAPFMRPAWDGNKTGVLDGVKDDMWREIEKALRRKAKKAAKAARS
jgi:HK97 gp10 family phage protein